MSQNVWATIMPFGLVTNFLLAQTNFFGPAKAGPHFRHWDEDLDVIFNTVIFISKWEIWKIRNKVKYKQSRIGDQTIFNTWKNNIYNAHYKLRILMKMIKTN